MLALTRNYSIKSEYPVQWIELSLTYECPNHSIVRHVISSWIEFSLTVIFGWRGQTILMTPILSIKLKKVVIKSLLQYGKTTYSFITYWMQRSILFCCTETNNILRAVSSSEDAIFSMRTFTWSWWLPGVCRRSTWGWMLSRSTYITLGKRLTGTCLQSRHLHVVERHIRTMVIWTSFPPVPPHFGDWHRHLHQCHISESSDHRTW